MNFTDEQLALRELRAAVASTRPDAIVTAVSSNIWPLYSTAYAELTAAIEALPQAVLQRHPVLRVVHRMTPILARTTRPFKPLVYPEDTKGMSSDELDVLTLVQMIAFRFSGDVAAAVIYARRLQERIAVDGDVSDSRLGRPLWYYHHQIGSTFLAAGDAAEAFGQFTVARAHARTAPQPDAERMAIGRCALARALQGALDEAEDLLAGLASHPEITPAHASSIALTERTTRALVSAERMAPDAESLIATLEPYDSPELTWPFALLARTRVLLALQRPREALEAVRLASDAHPDQHGSFASDVINAASIEALWHLGDAKSARLVTTGRTSAGVLTRIALIKLALREGRLATASREIGRLAALDAGGIAVRDELAGCSIWLATARTGSVSGADAQRVVQLLGDANSRRIVSGLPQQLILDVRSHLARDAKTTLPTSVSPLTGSEPAYLPSLTSSELRALSALVTFRSTAEIAAAFHLSPNTVKSQLRSLYRKLGCSSRNEALRTAARLRLITFDND